MIVSSFRRSGPGQQPSSIMYIYIYIYTYIHTHLLLFVLSLLSLLLLSFLLSPLISSSSSSSSKSTYYYWAEGAAEDRAFLSWISWAVAYISIPKHTYTHTSTLPYLTLPYLTLPYVKWPSLTLPEMTWPYLTLPKMTWPDPTVPYLANRRGERPRGLRPNLNLRGGIPRPTGNLPEMLSQRILAGIVLVGRLAAS